MPTVTDNTIRVWAFCLQPLCQGFRQTEVDGFTRETAFLFSDNGGDIPGVERSTVEVHIANDTDKLCDVCGGPREASRSPRTSYEPLSGFDPMGLHDTARYDATVVNTPDDERFAAMQAQLEAQSAQIEALLNRATQPDEQGQPDENPEPEDE